MRQRSNLGLAVRVHDSGDEACFGRVRCPCGPAQIEMADNDVEAILLEAMDLSAIATL